MNKVSFKVSGVDHEHNEQGVRPSDTLVIKKKKKKLPFLFPCCISLLLSCLPSISFNSLKNFNSYIIYLNPGCFLPVIFTSLLNHQHSVVFFLLVLFQFLLTCLFLFQMVWGPKSMLKGLVTTIT